MATSIWDVNKYRSEFESEEHWQLRKKFMETHVDKFSEDKLVCLARVFFNIEFLGCRYPEKTMRLIAELSKGVADEHREKQKGKLKRTFVQASDAAGAKIKGSGIQIKDEPPDKKPKTSEERIGYCSAHSNLTKPPSLPKLSGEFSDLIIFENCNKLGKVDSCPITILNNTVQKNGPSNTIAYSVLGRRCDIKINNKLLASEEASTVKEAKLNAAIKGLKLLRKSCFTIQGKRAFFSNEPSITKDSKVTDSEGPLPEHNIGSKMMRKMGWTGSGLGKSQQGIQDPVQASPQIMHRAGFGSVNEKELQNKFRTLFKDYIKSNSEHDLLFSPDFTIEERKTLHKLAQNLGLKTRSYGKGNFRHLVVSKQMSLRKLVQDLMECGGENEKYLLIHPYDEDDGGKTKTSSVPNEVIKIEDAYEAVPMSSEIIKSEQDTSKVAQISSIEDVFIGEVTNNLREVLEKPMKDENEELDKYTDTHDDGVDHDDGDNDCDDKVCDDYLDDDYDYDGVDGDLSLVDQILQKRDSKIEEAFEDYNKLVRKFHATGQFESKKERRTYSFWREQIKRFCGIQREDLSRNPLNIRFNVEEYLIDTKLIFTPNSEDSYLLAQCSPMFDTRIEEAGPSHVPLNFGGLPDLRVVSQFPKGKCKGQVRHMKKRMENFKNIQFELNGRRIIKENPQLRSIIESLACASVEAKQRGDNPKAKYYRRQITCELQRMGGRRDLPKYSYTDIFKQ